MSEIEQLREENARLRARNAELDLIFQKGRHLSHFPIWTQRQFQFKSDKISGWLQQQKAKRIPGEEEFEILFLETFGMTWDYWIGVRDWHLEFFQRERAEFSHRETAEAEA